MNTNDAKEYLARREIPLLFEVGGCDWQRGGGWGASGECISGVWGEEAAPRPTLPTRGVEVKGLTEARPPARSARPAVAASPGCCRGPCPLAGLRSPHFPDQVSVFQRVLEAGCNPRKWMPQGGLQAAAGRALWRRGPGQVGALAPWGGRSRVLTPPRAEGRGPRGEGEMWTKAALAGDRGPLGGEG